MTCHTEVAVVQHSVNLSCFILSNLLCGCEYMTQYVLHLHEFSRNVQRSMHTDSLPLSLPSWLSSCQHIDQIMSSHGKQIMQAVTLILEAEHSIEVKEQVSSSSASCLQMVFMQDSSYSCMKNLQCRLDLTVLIRLQAVHFWAHPLVLSKSFFFLNR